MADLVKMPVIACKSLILALLMLKLILQIYASLVSQGGGEEIIYLTLAIAQTCIT